MTYLDRGETVPGRLNIVFDSALPGISGYDSTGTMWYAFNLGALPASGPCVVCGEPASSGYYDPTGDRRVHGRHVDYLQMTLNERIDRAVKARGGG